MKNTIEQIKLILDENGSNNDIFSILRKQDLVWNKENKRIVEEVIRSRKENNVSKKVASILVYNYFEGDEAIAFSRKRGVFAYYCEDSIAEQVLQKILSYVDILNISTDDKDYLHHKYESRWLKSFYKEYDEKIDKIIEEHEKKKKTFSVNGVGFESNIVQELLTMMELIFRQKEARTESISLTIESLCEVDYDNHQSYTAEQLGEAVSYVISRYCEKHNCEGKRLWIDAEAIIKNNELSTVILLTAKRKLVSEWEVSIDYYGYDIELTNKKRKDKPVYKIVDKKDLEKSLQLGLIKTDIQAQACAINSAIHFKSLPGLDQIAESLKKLQDNIFVLVNPGTEIERFQMQFVTPLVTAFSPKDYNKPYLFREECEQIDFACHEMLIKPEELLEYSITDLSNVKDIILFRRFFHIVTMLQQIFFEEHTVTPKTRINSIVPTFQRNQLVDLLTIFVGKREKAEDILSLYTWNAKEYLDVQSTPIIRINSDQYYIAPFVLSVSNLIRNVIVKERRNESQKTNPNGKDDPLERFSKEIFDLRKELFSYKEHCKFTYNGITGEVDLIVWSERHLYLIECKNSIFPTSPFELRTTYDYIEKAEKQLDLSFSALSDVVIGKQLLNNWGIPDYDYVVHTLIMLGNRIFTAPNGFRHPIRYAHELHRLFESGIIESSFGEWRYWEHEEFGESDFIRYLSKDDQMGNNWLKALNPYARVVGCGAGCIERESYSLNILRLWELNDKNFFNLSTNEHMKMRAEYITNHDEITKMFISTAGKTKPEDY